MSSSAESSTSTAVLLFHEQGGQLRRINLDGRPFRIGRASANELSFPENAELSREHFLVERVGDQWTIQDLNSRNGTVIDGRRIQGRVPLSDQDVIVAGHLSFTFMSGAADAQNRILLLEDASGSPPLSHTRSTDLKAALASESSDHVFSTERAHLRAFVRAGRELVSHRPMNELFQVILDMAVDAAGASRGVVALQDGNALSIRAQRGTGFRLSTAIVKQVLTEKKSLLIVDIAGESELAKRDSIVAGKVRSVIAVPLQTEDHAIGLLYVDTPSRVFAFTSEDLNLLTVMANVAAVRIENARLLEIEQEEKLWAHDRQQAAEIQRSLLPTSAPVIPGFEVAGYNAASRTVGGDYYDFLPLSEGRVGIVVADVAGKGMPAALLMSGLQAKVQVLFETGENLATQVTKLNRALTSRFPPNRFVTFFVAAVSPESGHIAFCNAGHNPPILLGKNGAMTQLSASGPVLGISTNFSFEEGACEMSAGDILALYSDGVTEACDPVRQEEFGEDRLLQTLLQHRDKTPSTIIDAVMRQISEFTGNAPLADDVTLVVARRVGA
jgi:phosphoserine phosphatase RsbU/P